MRVATSTPSSSLESPYCNPEQGAGSPTANPSSANAPVPCPCKVRQRMGRKEHLLQCAVQIVRSEHSRRGQEYRQESATHTSRRARCLSKLASGPDSQRKQAYHDGHGNASACCGVRLCCMATARGRASMQSRNHSPVQCRTVSTMSSAMLLMGCSRHGIQQVLPRPRRASASAYGHGGGNAAFGRVSRISAENRSMPLLMPSAFVGSSRSQSGFSERARRA